MNHNVPAKANRVLNVILLGLLLILIRVWYLCVIQRDDYLLLARKPQRRTLIERVERATIRDRFNLPLAVNKTQYNAAVRYADLRQIPSVMWKKDDKGKSVRVQARTAYIKELSRLLGKELQIDPERVEDTIHGQASLFPHTPFVVKEGISEEQFYRLRMLEKEWPGIEMQHTSHRVYPRGRCGADVVGYMGQINGKEYLQIAGEMGELQAYVTEREAGEAPILPKKFDNPLQVRQRLKELKEKSYTVNDLIGKAGIESVCDEKLRGYFGKKTFEVDTKGNFLRELPGTRPAMSGQRVLLSISSELQEYAESLLAHDEGFREFKGADGHPSPDRPWIKGGAIVAIHPQTGEVLALASYPRMDPNDFVPTSDPELKREKQKKVLRWLESEAYIGEIWDGKRGMQRELFSLEANTFYEETLCLDWQRYLHTILHPNSAVYRVMLQVNDARTAIRLQKDADTLLRLSGQDSLPLLFTALYPPEEGHLYQKEKFPLEARRKILSTLSGSHFHEAKQRLDPFLKEILHNQDKVLLIDLCRLLIDRENLSEELIASIGGESASSLRSHAQAKAIIETLLREQAQEWFHEIDFKKWREENFKEFLKKKRKEEKEKKHYTRPYTEYLELCEKNCFREFWQRHHTTFLKAFVLGHASSSEELSAYLKRLPSVRKSEEQASAQTLLRARLSSLTDALVEPYLNALRSFTNLQKPLFGRYRNLRNTSGVQQEKHLAAAFYPLSGFGYGRSQAYRQSSPQGSVFKVAVSYAALMERYKNLIESGSSLSKLSPLTLIDDLKWDKIGSNQQILGYTLDGRPITRIYKEGKLPRSHPNIGKIDLQGALEQSSNLYFAMLASDHLASPDALTQTARLFGCGERSGIDLPGEIAGSVPTDGAHNRTGLYSFAIGQHSLIVTPLQSALLMSAIANQGKLLKPKIIQLIAGKEPEREKQNLFARTTFPFQDALGLVGISFPLFTTTLKDYGEATVCTQPTQVRHILSFPDEVRNEILSGMHRVIAGPRGTARPQIIRALQDNPYARRDYLDLQNQMVGKTGTAEILYKQTIDAETPAEIVNHIWFSGIFFSSPIESNKPIWKDPELVVTVYLRFGRAGGKEAAPIAAQMAKKWQELCAKHGRSSHTTN